MATRVLHSFLERLGLNSGNSVFFPSEKTNVAIMLASEIVNKLRLIGPDAYYCFNNQPYILFFDLSDEVSPGREEQIHRQAWSFDCAPVVFIIKKAEVAVYNAFHYQKRMNRLEAIADNAEDVVDRFSFWKLQSGETWQWLQAEKYKDTIHKKRVNSRLFDNIREARNKLEEGGMTTAQANVIILRLIFIRYLIDRGVGIKKEYIGGESTIERRQSLSELIRNIPRLYQFFEYLNDRFNGALFKQKVSARINRDQAAYLSQLFDSRLDKSNPSLFPTFYFDIFDFSIIPVEVISGIYESIIDESTRDVESAIYTPPFLVEYMLTETIDPFLRKSKTAECKVLDPSCGSGIFLVQTYRRMVDEELRRNGGRAIESGRLREIAEKNLYGIDLNEQSLLVSSFSIYIAILDYKEPKEINRFLFPNLIGKNLFAGNFFDTEHGFNKILGALSFNFILGNPPWKNRKDDKAHVAYLRKNKHTVGRYEIAQSFLLRTEDFMSPDTRCALIVTSTIFYNISETTRSFREGFLSRICLDTFFDLSAVRRLVFESAISPASILFYRKPKKGKAADNVVQHLSVKGSIFLKHFRTLVIEKFDRKEISQRYFIEYDWLFKTALYGNTLDFHLLKKLAAFEKTVGDLIDEKTLFAGDGINRGAGETFFPDLIGMPMIENAQVQPFYTPVTTGNHRLTRNDVHLTRGRTTSQFLGEHILLKAQTYKETEIIVSYADQTAVYKHDTFGISSSTDTDFLKIIYAYFLSDLHTYYQYLKNCSWGIGTRPAIRLQEYLSFPYRQLDREKRGQLLGWIKSLLDNCRKSSESFFSPDQSSRPHHLKEINELVNMTYGITGADKDLIDYVLQVSRFQFQESKQDQMIRKVDGEMGLLDRYCEVFFREMDGLYEGEYLVADVYQLAYFVAIHFKLLPEKPSAQKRVRMIHGITEESKVLSMLSANLSIWNLTDNLDLAHNLYIQKDIKGYEKDSFYIIKPNEFKCWHRAMAWYDVADVKAVIEQAENELLNEQQ